MARYLLEDKNGVVVNMIALEPGSNYTPPEGLTVRRSEEDAVIGETVFDTAIRNAYDAQEQQALVEAKTRALEDAAGQT